MVREKVLKMTTCVTSMPEVLSTISLWNNNRKGRYICVANVHMCMEVFDNNKFEMIVNGADLIVADGKPILWAQKLLGHRDAKQVRGEDLVMQLCESAEREGMTVGFFGSSPMVLEDLKSVILSHFPRIMIADLIAPPFREITETENIKYISAINDSGIDILFVGLGCPKQEKWMADHKEHVSCTMIGVGAAFDFISGNKPSAPDWLKHIGLEWFFRLLSEPRRLWKRYLIQNPRFIIYLLLQLAKQKP